MKVQGRDYRTVWLEGSTVKTINRPLIPHKFEIATLPTHRDTAEAIKEGLSPISANETGRASGVRSSFRRRRRERHSRSASGARRARVLAHGVSSSISRLEYGWRLDGSRLGLRVFQDSQ